MKSFIKFTKTDGTAVFIDCQAIVGVSQCVESNVPCTCIVAGIGEAHVLETPERVLAMIQEATER